MGLVLVGAGGHAKAVVEALGAAGHAITAYVDPAVCAWLDGVTRYETDDASELHDADGFVVGLGAVSPEGLAWRLNLFRRYTGRGWSAPIVVHPAAFVSAGATLTEGSMALAGAIVQPGAMIGAAAIVNTGAIVEHDSSVGEGAHIAPGAIVLGGASVGACAMVGAGAILLPGAAVPDRTLVPARGRYPA